MHVLKKILISAGEESADFFAANLAKEIHKSTKGKVKILGFGGEKMKQAGVDVRIDLVKFALVGIIEVVFRLFDILRIYSRAVHIISDEKIDALIVLDYPGFHLKLIKAAKKAGVKKIIYYITPQVWAWHYERIYQIKKYVDLAVVILPFEKTIFEKEGINVRYFGHPAAESILGTTKKALKKHEGKIVGIFPGSRTREIKSLLPVICKACKRISETAKGVKFIIFKAGTIDETLMREIISRNDCPDMKIVDGSDVYLRKSLDCAIAKSGTITLELALLGIPELLVYRLNPVSFIIVRRLASTVNFIGLVNIILGKQVVKEFIQNNVTPENISMEAVKILREEKYRKNMKKNFAKLKALIYKKGTVKKTANAIVKELGQ